MELQPIIFDDIYDFATILKNIKLDISEEDQQRLENQGLAAGILMMKDALADIKFAKVEINTFLAGKFGITPAEFGNLGLRDSALVLREIAKLKKSGELLDFIAAVGELMS